MKVGIKRGLMLLILAGSSKLMAALPEYEIYRPVHLSAAIQERLARQGLTQYTEYSGERSILREGQPVATVTFERDLTSSRYAIEDISGRELFEVRESNLPCAGGLCSKITMSSFRQPLNEAGQAAFTLSFTPSIGMEYLRYGQNRNVSAFRYEVEQELVWLSEALLEILPSQSDSACEDPLSRAQRTIASDPNFAPYLEYLRIAGSRERLFVSGVLPTTASHGLLILKLNRLGFVKIVDNISIDSRLMNNDRYQQVPPMSYISY
jgi:hypothetical protein